MGWTDYFYHHIYSCKKKKKLDKDRIEVFSYEENAVIWQMKANGIKADNYEVVYTFKKEELYYAFHKDTPNSLIQKMQNALDELKKEGAYQKYWINIYDKTKHQQTF